MSDLKDKLGAGLQSMDIRFGVHLGSVGDSLGVLFGSIWGPCGVHVGSMLRSGSESGRRPPRGQVPYPLFYLGTRLGLHVGTMLAVVGRLGAS